MVAAAPSGAAGRPWRLNGRLPTASEARRPHQIATLSRARAQVTVWPNNRETPGYLSTAGQRDADGAPERSGEI